MEKSFQIVLAVIAVLFVAVLSFASGFAVAYLVLESQYNPLSSNSTDFPPLVKKPAIYLYPLDKSVVNVSVQVNGALTKTVPEYDSDWSVAAEPSGRINGRYDYLFYEAKLNKVELPAEGWTVRYDDLGGWFDVNLIRLGLSEREREQFKDYWMRELPRHECYEIRLLDERFLSENMKLSVEPKPDTLIRLNFYFRPSDACSRIMEPSYDTPERVGFTVVEWGGILES